MDEGETKIVLRLKLGSKLWEKLLDFLPPLGSCVVPIQHEEIGKNTFVVSSSNYFALEDVCEVDLTTTDEKWMDADYHRESDLDLAFASAGWYKVNLCGI